MNFIGAGLLGLGISSSYLTYNNYLILKKKKNSEQIYTYSEQIKNFDVKTNEKIIIKIPKHLINHNYLIGEISLEKKSLYKIIREYDDNYPNLFLTKYYKLTETDILLYLYLNKYNKITKSEISYDYIYELIKKQVLFPNIYPELNLSNNLYTLNKIKILFDNTHIITSHNNQDIFDMYEKDIKINIPNYFFDGIINFNSKDLFQIKKNVLSQNDNLFLLLEYSNKLDDNYNLDSEKKFNIDAISNSKDTILNYKYKTDNDNIVIGNIFSSLILSLGFVFIIINSK